MQQTQRGIHIMDTTTPSNNTTTSTTSESNPGFSAFSATESLSYIRPFNPSAPAIPNFRHAVVRYRDITKGVAAKPAKMVTIPELVFPEEYSLLPTTALQVFRGVIEDEQDVLIRSFIDTKSNVVLWHSVSLDACLAALTEIRKTSRLTKEDIAAYVRSALAPYLATYSLQISEAKGHTPEQTILQRVATLNANVDAFSKLSAPVPSLDMGQATKLRNHLTLAALPDETSKVLLAKLHAILNPAAASDDL